MKIELSYNIGRDVVTTGKSSLVSCGPELNCHGGADRYFHDMMLIETDLFMNLDCFFSRKEEKCTSFEWGHVY